MKEKSGTSAQPGSHDDRVIARAIALQMRKELGRDVEFVYIRGA